jgi:hypothetical protein
MEDDRFSKAERFILRLVLLLALVIESAQLVCFLVRHLLAAILAPT